MFLILLYFPILVNSSPILVSLSDSVRFQFKTQFCTTYGIIYGRWYLNYIFLNQPKEESILPPEKKSANWSQPLIDVESEKAILDPSLLDRLEKLVDEIQSLKEEKLTLKEKVVALETSERQLHLKLKTANDTIEHLNNTMAADNTLSSNAKGGKFYW